MSDLTILKDRKPAIAEFVERWRFKYQRAYDFSKIEDQAIFYEGLVEMGRHLPLNAQFGQAAVTVNVEGVEGLQVTLTKG